MKADPYKWLIDYIEAIENADDTCEQKLILPELKEVKHLLAQPEMDLTTDLAELLRDVALELQKSGNDDAANLLDRIDNVLLPMFGVKLPDVVQAMDQRTGPVSFSDVMYGKGVEEVTVAYYVPEFIDKLIEQLKSDHKRWGDTWLNRPKEGQELRTKARYTDYFDMFEQAGTPVPWLKIVGGALICWIRDNHPELYIDANECEDEGKHNPSTPWASCQACRDEGLVDEKPVEDKEIIGVKVSEDGVEDIVVEVEDMTTKELIESPSPRSCVCNEKIEHLNGYLQCRDGLILESIIFATGTEPKSLVVGRCDMDGSIVPSSSYCGLTGRVFVNGRYYIASAKGLLASDKLYVSYAYVFTPEDGKAK